jgi:hypothetical protein
MLNLDEMRLPSATVTVAGAAATAGLELDSETVTPPLGAAAFNIMELPPKVFPPTMLACESATEEGASGITVRVTGTATPLKVAVMVTGVLTLTAAVVILNAGEVVAPAATVTVAGTEATAGLLLESFTVAPAGDAGAIRVTTPEGRAVAPPTTDTEERFTEATPSGFMVRVATALAPNNVAVRVTCVAAAT